MERSKNIGKFKVSAKHNDSTTLKNPEINGLIGMVSELKSFFTKLYSRFESIEKHLISSNDEFHSENRQNIEDTPQAEPEVIIVSEPLSGKDDESMESEISETYEYSNIKKTNVLANFFDDSKHTIKEIRRGSNEPAHIRVPILGFFKLKLMRLYAKSIKLTINPKKTTKNNPDELLCLNYKFYTDHIIINQELVEDIIEDIKGNSKTITWYKSLFQENQARTENFRIFVENLFDKDIKKLIKKFCFKCCRDLQHVELCKEKWRLLRDWIFNIITGFNY